MKKLMKNGVYGSREQCMDALFTGEKSTTAVGKKKKKKAQVLNPDTNKSDPNGQLVQNGNPVLKKIP